jgi:hypothetical protein
MRGMLADIEAPPCPLRSRPKSEETLKSPPAAAIAAPDSTLAAIYCRNQTNGGTVSTQLTLISMGVDDSFMNAGVDLDRPNPSPLAAATGFPLKSWFKHAS